MDREEKSMWRNVNGETINNLPTKHEGMTLDGKHLADLEDGNEMNLET